MDLPLSSQYQGTSNDCAPYCVAMALNAYKGTDKFRGEEVAAQMNLMALLPATPGNELLPLLPRLPGRVPGWATFPWGMVDYLRAQGVPAGWHPFATEEELLRNIGQNQLTIIIVGDIGGKSGTWAHAMIVWRYDATTRTYYFVDPAAKGGELYPLPRGEFLEQWSTWWNILVELKEARP